MTSTVTTALAMSSNHGIVPVKKKSNAFPPESENPNPEIVIQLRKPPMNIAAPPPTINQSDVLNLLKSILNPPCDLQCP